jgi:hypothetical protein
MLLPRFSIRALLLITAAASVVALLLGFAVQGQVWAVAISIGLGSLVIALLVQAGAFGLIWLLSQIPLPHRKPKSNSAGRESAS